MIKLKVFINRINMFTKVVASENEVIIKNFKFKIKDIHLSLKDEIKESTYYIKTKQAERKNLLNKKENGKFMVRSITNSENR